jgi:hypothetical protein
MPSEAVTIGNSNAVIGLQGVEVRTFEQTSTSPLPLIRPNSDPVIVFDGLRIDSLDYFYDGADASLGTKKIKLFPNFEEEQRTFGQGIKFQPTTPVLDAEGFNPVTWIQAGTSIEIFPRTQGNKSYDNIDLYDGVIEPLDLRNRQTNDFAITTKFDIHQVEGGSANFATDARGRNIPIVSHITVSGHSIEAFNDTIESSDNYQVKNFDSFMSVSDCKIDPFVDEEVSYRSFESLDSEIQAILNVVTSKTDDLLPVGAISSASGQIVDLASSPGTDSIVYVGLKR